jgi:hypothetical protein
MTTLFLRRTMGGFAPDTEQDQEACKRFKMGGIVKAEIVVPRNYYFFKKWWALITVGFGLWAELCPPQYHKGHPVLPNIERFRKDVTIMTGHRHMVVNLDGELRWEADSIAFGNMVEETFEKLYSATIDVLLQKVLADRGITEERLREMANSVMDFA